MGSRLAAAISGPGEAGRENAPVAGSRWSLCGIVKSALVCSPTFLYGKGCRRNWKVAFSLNANGDCGSRGTSKLEAGNPGS